MYSIVRLLMTFQKKKKDGKERTQTRYFCVAYAESSCGKQICNSSNLV